MKTIKLSELQKQITPLPWSSVPGFHRTQGTENDQYATHCANVVPKLVERLEQMREAIPQNPRLALLWELKEAVNSALAEAQEVKLP